MKKIIYSILILLSVQLVIISCKEDEPELGDPPTSEEASFTGTPSENPNIIDFVNTSSAFLKKWEFGNGTKAEGDNVQGIYPFAGTYEVKLTIYTSGGSSVSTQEVVIDQDDPTLLDIPIYNMLTGGNASPEGKTWVVDSATAKHFGVGPNPSDPVLGDVPNYYGAGVNEKAGAGLYNDRFTFVLAGFAYNYNTKGDVFINNKYADEFPGSFANAGDFTAPFTAPTGLTWSITEESGSQYLTISTGGFIGYYSGVRKYKIISLTETKMVLRAEDLEDPGLAWYQTLIVAGTGGGDPEPDPTSTLPLDFEGAKPPFNGFGGSTYDVVANPSATGVNTSAKVAQYVKGGDGNWAGIETTLATVLDFSTNTTMKMKVYSPVTGRALFKVEEVGNPDNNREVFANITQVNQWQTLTFDFSGTTSGVFKKIALFMDFDNNNGGTFYLDDIQQVAPGCTDADEESLNATSLNLTMGTTGFGQFGNITAATLTNPFKTGINTSCSVNSYGKTAGCETWSGVGLLLPTALDFTTLTKKKFKMKVYAVNQVTTVTLRLERLAFPDTEPSQERTATITATGVWQELTFDFSDVSTNTFKNMLVYFERNSPCDGDVYYFDDIVQFE
jgi:hypothetical protein